MNWLEQAACATGDGFNEDFAVTRNDQENSPSVKRALAICSTCPVRAECEKDMLSYPDPPYRVVIAGMRPRQARRHWYETNGVVAVSRTSRPLKSGDNCGTSQGYQKHIRNGTAKCQPCREAHNAEIRMWRKLA